MGPEAQFSSLLKSSVHFKLLESDETDSNDLDLSFTAN